MEMKGPATRAEPVKVDFKQSPQNSVAISAFTASPLGTPWQSTGQSSQVSTVMMPNVHDGMATSVWFEGDASNRQLAVNDLDQMLKSEIQMQF